MEPTDFEQANCRFGPPEDMSESQVRTIEAWRGETAGRSCDGAPMLVTAWRPDRRELERLCRGHPIFVTFLAGGMPPHALTTDFAEATNIA